MENHSLGQVVGAPSAPYETRLAQQCGQATSYRSVGSPSLPNYIGATSGDTWGIRDDDPPAAHAIKADNLFRQVRASGRSAVSFQEAMVNSCALTSKGRYAVKHNPAAYYQGADDRPACVRDDIPLGTNDSGALHDALVNNNLPTFSFVTPDLCHDTHDCSVGVGDNWLAQFLPALLSSKTYGAGRTVIFLVWDEESPMPFVVIAPTVPTGSVLAAAVDHYSLLRTTEDLLGITTHLAKAAAAPGMRSGFNL